MGEAAGSAIDWSALAPTLGPTCRGYLTSYTRAIDAAVERGDSGLAVAARRVSALDGLLGALFCASDAASRARGHRPQGRVSLVAVGSYGRGTLSVKSDVDVIFLCDVPNDPHLEGLAQGFLYPLWDAGLKVGHAVRGVDETLLLAPTDISTATSILDVRRIGGDATLVTELVARARGELFGRNLAQFLDALEKDSHDRHERFGGSLYLLEPEVKLGRGSLRDLDVAIWAARARWPVADRAALVGVGALDDKELGELSAAQDMLLRVRNLLHVRARRAQDRLTFEDQEEIAVRLGFIDSTTLAVEQFMQAYYRHARNVASFSERLLKRARPGKRPRVEPLTYLPEGVVAVEHELGFHKSWALDARPELALELYVEVTRHLRPTTDETRDDILRSSGDSSWCHALRRVRAAAPLFCRLLCHAGEVPLRQKSILGELHELGLLLAMIPEFEPVTGRVQHDVYHVYTVDVHSIAAVDRLRALMRGDLALEQPLASQFAAETVRPLPLFLAVLLHDIGKAYGKDHSRQGAIMARPIAERLGLGPLDVDHVVWLVSEHLSLYHWATRRDTSDPSIIAEIARQVGSVDRLRDLFLLTMADVATTNPNAMTEWKARMLEDLYVAVARVLEGDAGDHTLRAADTRANARIGFVGDAGQASLEAFVDQMPERYLLAHPVDVIRAHARAARDRSDKAVHVAAFPSASKDVTELLVLTDDRAGLVADIAAALSANRIEITAAQIFSRVRVGAPPEAIDLFHVRPHGYAGEALTNDEIERVSRDIEAVLTGRVISDALLAKRPKQPAWAKRKAPDVRTKIVIDNHVSPRFTVVDVYARDHVGLLHTIAQTLRQEGLTIALAKVNTEGLKAADVFYVAHGDRGKLDSEGSELLRQKLFDAIEASREREA